MDEGAIKANVEWALQKLVDKDRFLLIFDANERSITHMLALYLRAKFPRKYDVDCEYNRDLIRRMSAENIDKNYTKRLFPECLEKYTSSAKELCLNKGTDLISLKDVEMKAMCDTNGKTVYPDIIIHKRGKSENLLAIEVKKTTSQENSEFDHEKLKAYMSKRGLGYQYALFICIKTLSPDDIKNIENKRATCKIGIKHAEFINRNDLKPKCDRCLLDIDDKILNCFLDKTSR